MFLANLVCRVALLFLTANAVGEALSTCSSDTQCPNQDAPKTSCVKVFGASDFTANGFYCANQDTSIPPAYKSITTSHDSKLQYELRRHGSELQWRLFRITKTKRGYVQLPIYIGLPKQDIHSQTQPQDLKWSALSLDSDSIDYTEPAIDVAITNIPAPYIESLQLLQRFRIGNLDACQLSVCDTALSPLLIDTNNEQLCSLGAQLSASFANKLSNATLAAQRLDIARACARNKINQLVSNHKPIPRFLRWEVAETSYQMARSLVKAGMLQAAIDATLVGLASSPLQRQKRMLYVTLGDLNLAARERKAAYSAYVHALKAIRQKGGAVETNNFLQSFEDSVGDFIGQVVSSKTHSSDLAFAIPKNYSQVRISLILHAEKDDTFGTWDIDEFETRPLVDPLTSFGRECGMNETSFDFCHSVV
mmetsp:Transcript_18121/g.28437  ORF Transcript_18121/g.28437 Transcript_18121/m.28437 type:complete len:421 (-) Transcript_18121:707-1969(-)